MTGQKQSLPDEDIYNAIYMLSDYNLDLSILFYEVRIDQLKARESGPNVSDLVSWHGSLIHEHLCRHRTVW